MSEEAPLKKGGPPIKLILIGLIVVGLFGAFLVPDVRDAIGENIESFNAWIKERGPIAYPLFVVVYIACTVLLIPGSVLTLGAGGIFGLVKGTIIVSIASTLGASAAFLIGRYFARSSIEAKIQGNEKFARIDQAVGREGFKIVFLTRLTPVFPFTLLNYAYGLTNVPFWHYFFASWIGMLPGTVLYVWAGALAAKAAETAAGASAAPPSTGVWALRIIGFIATIAVTVVITRTASRALNEKVGDDIAGDSDKSAS